MVASKLGRMVASTGMVFTPWTVERSSSAFGSPTSTTFPQINAGNLQQFPNTAGGYYLGHAGVSSLDYEDILLMLYALKWDVPSVAGVFSDYPATATAFANAVPQMDSAMPVSWGTTYGGVSSVAVPCNTWMANGLGGLPGYYAFLSGNNSCVLAPGADVSGCCAGLNTLFSVYNSASVLSSCLCESDFAGMMLGAFGPGNAPLGQGPIGQTMQSILTQCNAKGYTGLIWPGATNPTYDCNANAATKMVQTPNVPGSTRAPYLMALNSTSVTIRWRSASRAASVVCIGNSASSLTQVYSGDAAGVIEHTVVLTNLTASTVYMFSAGASGCSSTSNNYRFKTFPAPGGAAGSANVRFWAHGDFGSQTYGVPSAVMLDSGKQASVYSAWLAYEAQTGRTADAWLALGDLAYNTGSDPLYQYNVFNIYSSLMSRTPIYPVLGNHDVYSWMYTPVAASGYQVAFGGPLANSASLLNGPGVPSGTMRYYSFNIGRVHVVSLDSMTLRSNNSLPGWSATEGLTYPAPTTSMSNLPAGFASLYAAAGSPNQMEWLAADLAAVNAAGQTDWIVCQVRVKASARCTLHACATNALSQYHHPPHSDGSHESDRESANPTDCLSPTRRVDARAAPSFSRNGGNAYAVQPDSRGWRRRHLLPRPQPRIRAHDADRRLLRHAGDVRVVHALVWLHGRHVRQQRQHQSGGAGEAARPERQRGHHLHRRRQRRPVQRCFGQQHVPLRHLRHGQRHAVRRR